MSRFVKSTWFKIIVGLFVVLFIFIIIGAASSKGSSPLSTVVGTVTEPFSYASSKLGHGFSKISGYFKSKSAYQAEIDDLQKQIQEYQSQLADYEQMKQKNELYENALGVKEENPDYEFVSATVIGRDASNVYTSFTLNKGSADDVAVNDPVMCGEGQLVGVVTKVSPTYCVVSTILDSSVSVSCYEVRTRETGYIQNSVTYSASGDTKMAGLSRDTSITAGGVVCTSGIGGIFPRDLIIGTVAEVKDEEHDISSYAVIKPGVEIKDIEDCLIITSFEGQGVTG